MRSARKTTNEWEFQGKVNVWLNEEITKRPGLNVEGATQEKPRSNSGQRSDLIVWTDRASETAFLAIELKTPTTPINDPTFFNDAIEKAQHWRAKYVALWNMRELEVYETPAIGVAVLPSDAIVRSSLPLAITHVEDWLKPAFSNALRQQAVGILDAAVNHAATGIVAGHAIDAEIFVSRLTEAIGRLRGMLYRDLGDAARTNRKLQLKLNTIATEQGFSGFVEDISYAISGQIGYRFIGQVLFYFALRRKLPSLKPLHIDPRDTLPDAFIPFWNEVRRYDYEALFKPDPIERLIPIPAEGQILLRVLIDQLAAYDWASLTDDVLGSIFEHLIPREEQILLGQFYTPRPVADLLVALTIDGARPLVLDPGCGSGTFLMSSYSYLAHASRLSHRELLSTIWGFDISPFAAELAVINLFRQNLSEYDNFPRIVPGNFFDRSPGETVEFPAPKVTSGPGKVPVPIPTFNCIVGNPPYLRSQNQDDLDPAYRSKLFEAAGKAGIDAPQKTDLFAFFIYQAIRFMEAGSRLGFVTPASWLTADYAASLQAILLGEVRLVAVVASAVEAFFPQVDVNTVLLVAERVDDTAEPSSLRFVTLKKRIADLTSGEGEYWDRVARLARQVDGSTISSENGSMRVKIVDSGDERAALMANRTGARNWSLYMRAPLSYYDIFGN